MKPQRDYAEVQDEVSSKLPELVLESDSAMEILMKIHKLFPLRKAGMGRNFKGTHSVYMKKNKLMFLIWWGGYAWTINNKYLSLLTKYAN